MKSLKAAARRRANAPVESSATLCTAAEPLVSEAADSLEVAEAVSEALPPEVVDEAVLSAAPSVTAIASAVALRVPHCWFRVQTC